MNITYIDPSVLVHLEYLIAYGGLFHGIIKQTMWNAKRQAIQVDLHIMFVECDPIMHFNLEWIVDGA